MATSEAEKRGWCASDDSRDLHRCRSRGRIRCCDRTRCRGGRNAGRSTRWRCHRRAHRCCPEGQRPHSGKHRRGAGSSARRQGKRRSGTSRHGAGRRCRRRDRRRSGTRPPGAGSWCRQLGTRHSGTRFRGADNPSRHRDRRHWGTPPHDAGSRCRHWGRRPQVLPGLRDEAGRTGEPGGRTRRSASWASSGRRRRPRPERRPGKAPERR